MNALMFALADDGETPYSASILLGNSFIFAWQIIPFPMDSGYSRISEKHDPNFALSTLLDRVSEKLVSENRL